MQVVLEEVHPGNIHLIPFPNEIDIKKMGKHAVVVTDTCAAAQKLRRILVESMPGAYDFDCMHHFRNVWFGGVEKALTKRLNEILYPYPNEEKVISLIRQASAGPREGTY